MTPTTINIVSSAIFAIAVIHTFSTKFFEGLAHKQPSHAGIWHLLGEVEVVFGFWAMVLVSFFFVYTGQEATITYLEKLNFTEPLFVFVIMIIAASKPVLEFCLFLVLRVTALLPVKKSVGFLWVTLTLVPLLGSFITEPAAMTVAALLLRDYYFSKRISPKLMYAALAVLFVNISIGGALTPYAAPPILMVAKTWNWDLMFMLQNFGWRSAIAVVVNSTLLAFLFFKELNAFTIAPNEKKIDAIPVSVIAIHLAFLVAVVVSVHHSVLFMGLFLFFVGYTSAYARYQNKLIVRESLLVAFFLAGLVVLGSQQKWWLQSLLVSLDSTSVYYGATALTAITDNAAITYLGSLVEGLSDEFKYSLVAGALTGGGLTVIANAPNPAGFSILKSSFDEGAISPLYLFLYALPPTIIAIIAFRFI
ncbi:putative Na+/H+ antiporter [Polynucleobacter antarcticus]|uniref:Na+/H+ antiporter n=1 Tax=Polynucleobacter antarcticus TaxID=1743162 RepID=A0A6M9PX30_9BURK|nr:putative Na+/H+ antiporter [Polynucleobacter antarcticus]QKM63315.1 hypothetical protein DCO16_09850 [Polynucleobacter antarcticus]